MKYKPYEFKPEDAYSFAQRVGIQTKERGDELIFQICPYCRNAGKGNKEKFAINLHTGQFKCLRASCGASGNMITLSRDFGFSLGNEVDEYYRPKKKYRRLKNPSEPYKPKPAAIKFLESRGISQKVADLYEITTQTGRDNILVFPFYDEKNKLQFVKYRKTDFDKDKDSAKEWCEKNCRPILFGMNHCNRENKTIVITEGQMDSLACCEAEIENVVSVPTGAKGFTWVPYCWDFLQEFETLIVFGDNENGSISLLDEMKNRFHGQVRHIRTDDYRGCKDANELLMKYGKKAVSDAVSNAVCVPVKKVIPLADVETINIYELPKLKTGIKTLDVVLYGGVPFGCVCLIAGKRGSGKSTFASQIMVNAVEQGYVTFAYSGELPNYLYKSWFDFQIAGRNHITENQRDYGGVNRFITNPNQEAINSWYRDLAFIYDSSMVDTDEKEDLLDAVEKSIMQHGAKIILIDNLMTAMYIDEQQKSDKYESQSNFVQRLTQIAIKYNVLVLLVVHQRKNQFGQDLNDEISGSGDISNLAGLVLNYVEYTSKEIEKGIATEEQRKLTISKNRLFGKTNLSGIKLSYDEKSKRIYGEEDDLNRQFGWERTVDDFTVMEEDIPF